jgi:hypothetical protein
MTDPTHTPTTTMFRDSGLPCGACTCGWRGGPKPNERRALKAATTHARYALADGDTPAPKPTTTRRAPKPAADPQPAAGVAPGTRTATLSKADVASYRKSFAKLRGQHGEIPVGDKQEAPARTAKRVAETLYVADDRWDALHAYARDHREQAEQALQAADRAWAQRFVTEAAA